MLKLYAVTRREFLLMISIPTHRGIPTLKIASKAGLRKGIRGDPIVGSRDKDSPPLSTRDELRST